MLPFKLLGLVLIFLASAGFGLLKTDRLSRRAKLLEDLCKGISRLSEYIRADGGNKERLISRCFSDIILKTENGKTIITANPLSKQDKAVLIEFFDGLGHGDRETEYRRARLYFKLLEERSAAARETFSQTGRLYTTLGILFGAFLCIFFI